MTLSIRLHSILCRSESDENSDSDEPYVLVTTVKRPQGKTPADVRTIQHGPWEMDDGDVIEPVSARAIWDTNGRPADIMNPDDVIIIVTLVENDQGSPGGIRTLVQSTATATMAAAVTAAREVQVARLLQDLPGAVIAADVGFLGDDHVGTRELRLTPADLAAKGTRFKVLEINGGDDGSYQLTFRLEELHRYEFAATAHLAAVTRDQDRMEVWAVDGNGVLVGNPFEGRWHGWYERPGVPLVPASNLAALSRDQHHMEVWTVGTDSTVHGVFFQHGWRDWYPLPGVRRSWASTRRAFPRRATSTETGPRLGTRSRTPASRPARRWPASPAIPTSWRYGRSATRTASCAATGGPTGSGRVGTHSSTDR
jgi:hypothetical protein